MEVSKYAIFSVFYFKLFFTGQSQQVNFEAYDNFQQIILLAGFAFYTISEHVVASNFTQHIKLLTFTKNIFQHFKNFFFIRPIFLNQPCQPFCFYCSKYSAIRHFTTRICMYYMGSKSDCRTNLFTHCSFIFFFHQQEYKAKFI